VGQLVRIVDPERHTVCPDGAVGEIWVRGPHLASGYWRRPGATAEAFGALVRDPPEGTPARGWLRTGDLGLIHDGLLYITGRIKDLIVVDGRNHYPQDIEATVADAHPAIRRGRVAAFGIRDGDGEAVAVLAEHVPGASLDPVLVAKAVRRAVSEGHEVALRGFRLGAPGTVPRTSSGKVARAAAKARFESE
jgi:fatty acid CoA ligase FadD32